MCYTLTMKRARKLRLHRASLLFVVAAGLLVQQRSAFAQSDPVGDFFKRVGRSISHASHPATADKPKTQRRRGEAKRSAGGSRHDEKGATQSGNHDLAVNATQPGQASVAPDQQASARSTTAERTPAIEIRYATAVTDTRGHPADLPYAVPVADKPGLVTSPYAPHSGYVDVHGLPSGSRVKDPYTGKIFLTP